MIELQSVSSGLESDEVRHYGCRILHRRVGIGLCMGREQSLGRSSSAQPCSH